MFTSLAGQQITARFKSPSEIKKGGTRTFFANGWIFGKSVAVDVLGATAGTTAPAAASLVRSAAVAAKDSTLRARLDSAELAVVGRVADVAKSDQGPTRISEHDPNWHEATIDVDEVVKGKKSVKQVTALFPGSDDARWFKVAK